MKVEWTSKKKPQEVEWTIASNITFGHVRQSKKTTRVEICRVISSPSDPDRDTFARHLTQKSTIVEQREMVEN